jgi:hypothetical protein
MNVHKGKDKDRHVRRTKEQTFPPWTMGVIHIDEFASKKEVRPERRGGSPDVCADSQSYRRGYTPRLRQMIFANSSAGCALSIADR